MSNVSLGMSSDAPHKKDTPSPIARAVEAGVAPRAVSPLRRFAVPAGLALGLGLTGTGLALELRGASTEGESCSRATNGGMQIRGINPLKWIRPDPAPITVAGGTGTPLARPAPPTPQVPVVGDATPVPTTTATPTPPPPPPAPTTIPTHDYPRSPGKIRPPSP